MRLRRTVSHAHLKPFSHRLHLPCPVALCALGPIFPRLPRLRPRGAGSTARVPTPRHGWSDTKLAANPRFTGAVLFIACKLLMEPFIGKLHIKEN